MDFTYISNNKTAGMDIRYNIPGHFSFATFYTYFSSVARSLLFQGSPETKNFLAINCQYENQKFSDN